MNCVTRIPQALVAAALLLMAACNTSPASLNLADGVTPTPSFSAAPTARPELIDFPDDSTWILKSIYGKLLIENTHITLTVGASSLSGFAGCNAYGGRSKNGSRIAGTGGTFSSPNFVITEMGCQEPAGILDQEEAYVEALWNAKKFHVADDGLELLNFAGEVILVFVRQEELPGKPIDLAGTRWKLVPEDEQIDDIRATTMAFLDDHRVAGTTACRDYLATYGASPKGIRFRTTSMVSDDRQCFDRSRELEGEFITYFYWMRDYSVVNKAASHLLIIRTSRGETLTFEPLPQAIDSIADSRWILKAFVKVLESGLMSPTQPRPGTDITMSFEQGSVSGSAGCNSYQAQYSLDDPSITISTPVATTRECPDPDGVMQQETQFLDLLPSLTQVLIYGDRLFIYTGDGRAILFTLGPTE